MAYNPYYGIEKVVNAKSAYGQATTDEERAKQRGIADVARQELIDNGYGYIADQISSQGATLETAQKILKQYASPTKISETDKASYNPYSAINGIYQEKVNWDKANKAGDTTAKNKAAENAQTYYKQLSDYGYTDVAKALNGVDATGAMAIRDQYSTKNSGVNNLGYSTSMQSASDNNKKLAGYIDSDRNDMQGKYNDLYGYANQDITKTDEYKSTFDNLMAKYDLSALQGRDNAVASGGASNGGNIDSYSAANAMRQQAALTATGQQIAHQAGLDAYNSRISNVSNILNNLGVYNSSTYDAMNQVIGNDRNIANDYFNNDETAKNNEFNRSETAKNNEVARLSEQANVTGYVPNEWVIKNDDVYRTYLNEDGSFKKEMENVDIQALINRAKSSGDTETANKLAVVRARKILSNYGEYGKYANEGDISYMKPQQTETGRQFDKTDATTRESLKTEKEINDSKNQTEKEINAANNQTNLDLVEANKNAQKEIIEHSATHGVELDSDGNVKGASSENQQDTFEKDWNTFKTYFTDTNVQDFLDTVLKPHMESGSEVNESTIERLICGTDVLNSNSTTYDIDVEDAREICEALGLDSTWVNKYTNRTVFNKGKGMKKAN